MVRVAMHLAAETRSFGRAAVVMTYVLGHGLSAKSIERLTHQVGAELGEQRTSPSEAIQTKEVIVPEVAVVSCDGGRIHTREPGHGPGVHGGKWRETKNASFERMKAPQACAADPCPALPETFREVGHVAKIAEKAAFKVACPAEERPPYEGPKRLLRTGVSSLAKSREFGPQMQHEAQRRRFFEAQKSVFIGDGLPWNWSIWRAYFPSFTPILDFIHAVQYLYAAAQAWEPNDTRRWSRYLALAEAVWQGRTADVIEQLDAELTTRGAAVEPEPSADDPPEDDQPADGPHQPLIDAARYLRNNLARMDYPRYRREGLPITSSPMESLIKQVNQRVKGTEMFWNEPAGAEAILQIRAASLCEDNRLDDYLCQRPGCPFTRRHPTLATAA